MMRLRDLQSAFASQSNYLKDLNESMVDNAKTVAGILTETRDELSAWVEEGMKAASANPVVKAVYTLKEDVACLFPGKRTPLDSLAQSFSFDILHCVSTACLARRPCRRP